jgi:hypothetical protein
VADAALGTDRTVLRLSRRDLIFQLSLRGDSQGGMHATEIVVKNKERNHVALRRTQKEGAAMR